jgi:hypothetical protein
MGHRSSPCRVVCFFASAIIALSFPTIAQEVTHQPNKALIDLKFKFQGAAGCAAANCHGATAPAAGGALKNEQATWLSKDKHAKAFRSLVKTYKNEEAGVSTKDIADALKIANPTVDARCINCHTVTVPKELQMDKYEAKEGVTCAACHGPYEKWEKDHAVDKVGANPMRAKAGYAGVKADTVSDPSTQEMRNLPYSRESDAHKKLLTDTGLFDTRPIVARGQICTSCHLKIDPALVAAGHPQPQFELASYSKKQNPHWRDPGGYFDTKVWLAGQAVCLIDAMEQLNDRVAAGAPDDRVKEAAEQAMGHYRSLKAALGATSAKALDDAAAKVSTAVGAKDKAAVAASTKAVADWTKSILPKVGELKIDANAQKMTAKILSKLAKESSAAKDGVYSAFQLQKSLAAVYGVYADQAKPGDAGAVKELIDKKLMDTMYAETWKPDDYNKVLADIAAKLPADAAGGPDAIE